MITEDYVSFETAKLLKKKGFNGFCACCYEPKNGILKTIFEDTSGEVGLHDWNNLTREMYNRIGLGSWFGFISAPSIAIAMKWLREVQGINIYARAVWKDVEVQYGNWEPAVVGYNWFVESLLDETYSKMSNEEYNSYEEACEAAIKYCLENLI